MRERAKTTDSAPGRARPPETYRSVLAPLTWWVWVAFAAANLIDIAVQGRDRASVTPAAALLLATAVAYVAALRPRVIAGPGGIVVRNPLRDHRLPWPGVVRVDLSSLLRFHCAWPDSPEAGKGHGKPEGARPETVERTRVFHAWAIQSSRRPGAVTGLRPAFGRDSFARRPTSGYARPPDPPSIAHRKETERIARALDERARAEREQAAAAAGGTGPLRPVSAWHWPSILALLLTAALLIAAILA
jgi:Bacterial PH domain